jgi:hypothetical protein
MAARSMRHSETALGAYHRRIAPRIGGDRAVFATAGELTTLIYRLLRRGQPHVEQGVRNAKTGSDRSASTGPAAKGKELGYQPSSASA